MTTVEKVRVYSVSELTREVKSLLEASFPAVWLEGEVSNVRLPSSGHLYMTLKDVGAQIQAVCFNFKARVPGFTIQDGLKVIVFGNITVYEKNGNYQINIKKLEPAGIGALQLAFEQLKKKLFEEGLFDSAHKRPIPLLPSRIGVVTSPTGAAIRDILNVLDRRFSNVNVVIAPAMVQGDRAPREIVRAIEVLNDLDEVEVIVVTRGGGSLEDLWAFNDERVARAIYDSRIPVISAVGHEIDWTIADFVADLRCPTPSAAAELVIGKKSELMDQVQFFQEKMLLNLRAKIEGLKKRVQILAEHPFFKYPKSLIEDLSQSVDLWVERIENLVMRVMDSKRGALAVLSQKLEVLSPLSILSRGYSVTRQVSSGKLICDVSQAAVGDEVEILLAKGALAAMVKELKERGSFDRV